MPTFIRVFTILCLAGGLPAAAALGCVSAYDPTAQAAYISCVGLGETQAFAVSLAWAGGNTFTLTSSQEYVVQDAGVDSLKILTIPVPIAIIYGAYGDGCTSAYGRPSLTQTGTNLDIRIKQQRPLSLDFACTQALVPFVEVVSLPDAAGTQSYTYSVNGVSITPTY